MTIIRERYILNGMRENIELNQRIVKNWKTGKYKTFSSLSRVMHLPHPNTVKRAVLRQAERDAHAAEVMAKARRQAAENINAKGSLNGD